MSRSRTELETIQAKARGATPVPRRTRVVLRKLGPWSVFKWSMVFYFAVALIFMVSAWFLFTVLETSGMLAGVQDSLGGLGVFSDCQVADAAVSLEDDCALVIDKGALFTALAMWSGLMVVLWSVFNLLVTVLYNLVSDIIGGVEMTLVDRRG